MNKAEIEFLILANHVEAANGLLYISGGGWTDHHRLLQPGQPLPASHMGIGISVLVPWTETNRPHLLRVRMENEDATVTLFDLQPQLNLGRPPMLSPGTEQHAVLAIEVGIQFPAPGIYRVVAELEGSDQTKRWPFQVHDIMQTAPVVPRSA